MKQTLFVIAIFCFFSSYSQTVPSYVDAAGLKGWWSFTGNAIDSSGNGYDGTVYGATLTTDRFGNANNAYQFTDDTITTTYPGVAGDSDRTITFWFYLDSIDNGNDEHFMLGYGSGLPGYASGFDCNVNDSSVGIDGSACYAFYDTLQAQQWYFYAITYSAAFGSDILAPKVYINDTLQLVPSLSLVNNYIYTGTARPFSIGSNGNTVNDFHGKIDDIGVWNRVLSDCEISKLYYSVNSLITSDPVNDTVIVGSSAMYSITDTGGSATYQWQVDDGTGFVDLSNAGAYSGVDTKTLTINPVTATMNNYQYRCVRNGGMCVDTSNSAKLIVNDVTSVNAYSANNDVIIAPNPVNDILTISGSMTIEKVELINMFGQVALISKEKKNDLSKLTKGLYILKINNKFMEKIFKN